MPEWLAQRYRRMQTCWNWKGGCLSDRVGFNNVNEDPQRDYLGDQSPSGRGLSYSSMLHFHEYHRTSSSQGHHSTTFEELEKLWHFCNWWTASRFGRKTTVLHVRCILTKQDGGNLATSVGSEDKIAPVNFTLHSLCKQLDVDLNGQEISNSSSMYL